ncbi:MAG: proteasome accessory factor PafA2 family protein [Candidatus Saccharimonas sp.]
MTSLEPNFFQNTPQRAMGSETEYTVQHPAPLPPLRDAILLRPYIQYERDANDYFLSNGARLYYDMAHSEYVGDVVEYATPECLSAEQVLTYEKAGEQIVTEFAYEIAANAATGYPVFKRSSYAHIPGIHDEADETPGSYQLVSAGHHENYSTPLTFDRDLPLLSYLVTRPLWAGAGIVTENGYELSQKRNALSYGSDSEELTIHGHKMPIRWRPDRLEVRSGDGNMSPWAIRTKFAMTSLVLRLIEHNAFPRDAIFSSRKFLQAAAERASTNPLAVLIGLHGRGENALSHQAAIASAGMRFADKYDIPKEEYQAAKDVLEVSRSFTPYSSMMHSAEQLADRVDWAAKLVYIRNQLGLTSTLLADITTNSLPAVQYDLLWEAMGYGAPSTRHYTRTGNVTKPKRISQALDTTPNTRARVRTQLLREFGSDVLAAGWGAVALVDGYTFYLSTPYREELRRVSRL